MSEDEIEINFKEVGNKIKKWFKQDKPEEKKKKDDNEDELNLKEAIKFLKENKQIIFYSTLIGIILLGTWIRTLSIPNYEGMLIGLDEFVFHRYGETIIETGGLPENDSLRYFPTGFKTHMEHQVTSYMIAGFYYLLKVFNPGVEVMMATIWLPVPAFLIAMIFFYLMVKDLIDKRTAFIATAFLSFIPSYLFRTLAGVTDKESVAMMLWFSMTWLLIKAVKSNKTRNAIIYGLASGILGGINGLTWAGVSFLFQSIGASFMLLTLMNRLTKKQALVFYLWFIPTIIMNSTLLLRYINPVFYELNIDYTMIITHQMFIIPVLTSVIILLRGMFHPLIKTYKKLPEPLTFHLVIILSLIAGMLMLEITGIFHPIEKINNILNLILAPFGTGAFEQSVSENQPPYFIDTARKIDWWHGMQWTIPLFMIGAVLLFHEINQKFGKKAIILTILYTAFMTFFMFSRFSSDPNHELINTFFGSTYLYTLPLLFIAITLFFIKRPVSNNWSNATIERLLLITWFSLSVIGTRGAIRVVFSSTPVFMIIAAYAVTKIKDLIHNKTKDKIYAYSIYAIAGIITIWAFTLTSANAAQFYSSFTNDWVTAMNWVQENTPENAVFAHWWDYGYWVQTMGNRATLTDGGNFNNSLNVLIGGQLFSAYNITEVYETLTYFTHPETGQRPDYFLIMDDDVLKYYQMANIGQRFGYYSPFYYAQRTENTVYERETYPLMLVFNILSSPGYLGEDVITSNALFPKEKSYLVNILVPATNEGQFGPAIALLYNTQTGIRAAMPYDCICEENIGCTTGNAPGGINSCILFTQGGAIHIPANLKDRLMTNLYILNKTIPGFEIAYTTPAPLTLQGIMNSGDPTDITIYKINYTEMKKWVDNASPAW